MWKTKFILVYTFSRTWYFPRLLYVPSVVSVMSSPELNFNLYMLSWYPGLVKEKKENTSMDSLFDGYRGILFMWRLPARRDRVRNEVIRDRVGVAPIEEKLTQHRLRWFGHVQQRPSEAPVHNGVLERVDNVKRGRCRPKLTWDESVKRDFKDWDISEELALDRSVWRLAINVPEPWHLCLLGFISSLPQLAWDKRLCCCC